MVRLGWLCRTFAEHLGLRGANEIANLIEQAGLRVLKKHDIRPQHGKVFDTTDPLHLARSQEITSLWCLNLAADGQQNPLNHCPDYANPLQCRLSMV